MTPQEMSREGRRLSDRLEVRLKFLHEQIPEAAAAERDYRKAKAEAWLRCPNDDAGVKAGEREWTAARREAWVNAQTADLRYVRDLAEGNVRLGHQGVRASMAQISLLQSEMNAFRSEANFAQYGIETAA